MAGLAGCLARSPIRCARCARAGWRQPHPGVRQRRRNGCLALYERIVGRLPQRREESGVNPNR
ncbi:hypothetical protein ACTMU2_20740 [Cupriavidus basilensis]